MKVKEAIAQLEGIDNQHQALCKLFMSESKDRITLRAAGKKPSPGVVSSIVEEMKEWTKKVAEGLDFSPKSLKLILDIEPARVYLEYGLTSPEFQHAVKKGRLAMLKGVHPLFEWTMEDIDAMAAWSMSRMFKDFENMRVEDLDKTHQEGELGGEKVANCDLD